MILPVVAIGHPNLRKMSVEITPEYPGLQQLITDMWETMYSSSGVGLAAPQINKQIRIFVIDATAYGDERPETIDFKKAFINAKIIEERGDEWAFSEGCLSIPDIHEDVMRKADVRLAYYDEEFNFHDEWFTGMPARIIQHEYDHLDGVLFVDKIHPLRKIMIKRKLQEIAKGITEAKYKMIFPARKR